MLQLNEEQEAEAAAEMWATTGGSFVDATAGKVRGGKFLVQEALSMTWCRGCWPILSFTLATCVACCPRLKRENVIFLVQEQHPGFTYDSVQKLFVKVESEGEGVALQQPSSGVALSQVSVGRESKGKAFLQCGVKHSAAALPYLRLV